MNNSEAGIAPLSELLRVPDDLDRLASLKAEFVRKKAAVDVQLKRGANEQLERTQAGMTSISDAQHISGLLREEMMRIDHYCADSQQLMSNFAEINAVAQAHRNFVLVQQTKKGIETFNDRLDEINRLLKQDDEDLQNQPNLLKVHFLITKLRNIRDDSMEQVKRAEDSSMEGTLQDFFRGLDAAIDDFDDHVGFACTNLIPLVQSDSTSIVTRLAIIIEEEEKFDKRIDELEEAQRDFQELASRLQTLATGGRVKRGYKNKFLESIKFVAGEKMSGIDELFMEAPEKMEKYFRWFFTDLNVVKLGMTPLMPKKWHIFETYAKIYHELMLEWIDKRINDENATPTHMLAIIHWKDKYYDKVRRLGIPEDTLDPPLPGGSDSDLVRDYRQLIVSKVDQWMAQINKTDTQAFKDRDEMALDEDERGHLRTKSLGDMWRMLHEQLAVAATSELTDVVESVIDAMYTSLKMRQDMWSTLLMDETERYSKPDSNKEGWEGLQEWLLAVANDQMACIGDEGPPEGASPDQGPWEAGYLDRFKEAYGSLASQNYVQSSDQMYENLKGGLVDLSFSCITTFARLIIAIDFREIMGEFFTSAWFTSQAMGAIVSTFEDYLSDYATRLPDVLYAVLAEELSKRLLIAYLGCVHNKGAKFKRGSGFEDKFKDDVLTVFKFYQRTVPAAHDEVKIQWRAVEGLVGLLTCAKHVIPNQFRDFASIFPDVRLSWVEAVLRARDDVEFGLSPLGGDGRTIFKNLRTIAAEVRAENREGVTVFSEVA